MVSALTDIVKEHDDGDGAGEVAKWATEIRLYDRESEKWREKSKKIIKRYKDERGANDTEFRFNILWSNVQTLLPALFAKNPEPNVERRFQDDDDAGRYASQVLERCIKYFIDEKFYDAIKESVLDRLLPGRGTHWIRYNLITHDDSEISDVVDDPEQQGQKEAQEYGEELINDYVHWQDFGHTWGRTWSEVKAGWRKVYLDRNALEKRFPEDGKNIPLDFTPEKINEEKVEGQSKKATIYEIWDKDNKIVIWIHKDYPKVLDKQNDPLKLKEFFPFPRPMFATLANDTCVPVPDYTEYQDQAAEMDDLTGRIHSLTKAVKVAGVYDGSVEGLQRLLTEGIENTLVAVDTWAAMAEKGGLKGVIDFLPLEMIVKALLALHESRDKVKNDLYEITGMSDIIRGQGDSDETATGVKAKGQFATLRLNAMQAEVSRFCRDIIRIMGEIISTQFELETIRNISGVILLTAQEKQIIQQFQQVLQQYQQQAQQTPQPGMQPAPQMPPPQPPVEVAKYFDDPEKLAELMMNPVWEEIFALLRNDSMRCFRIDIETDSTIKADQEAERLARVEFLTAAGGFIQQAATVQNPDLQPLLMRMLEFGVRGFKVGKDLETAFEVANKKIEKDAENQQPKPNPEIQKIQAEGQVQAQIENMKHQNAMQAAQADITIEQAKAAKDAEFERARAEADQQTQAMELSHTRQLEDMKIQHDTTKLMINRDIEKMKLDHAAALQSQQHAHEKELNNQKIASSEKQTRATLRTQKTGNGDGAADVVGLARDEDAAPDRFDNLEKGQSETANKMQALEQAQAATVNKIEDQMRALLKIAQLIEAAVKGIGDVHKQAQSPKEIEFVKDEEGRINGARVRQ